MSACSNLRRGGLVTWHLERGLLKSCSGGPPFLGFLPCVIDFGFSDTYCLTYCWVLAALLPYQRCYCIIVLLQMELTAFIFFTSKATSCCVLYERWMYEAIFFRYHRGDCRCQKTSYLALIYGVFLWLSTKPKELIFSATYEDNIFIYKISMPAVFIL